jgi:hypothetical protein
MAITLTRQQLYDRVWTIPVHTLAKELGISDVGLAKLCARYDIPMPPRGYWAKKAAQKRVKQPRLPALEDPHRQKVHFAGPAASAQADQQPEKHPLIVFERDPTNAILAEADLPLNHPPVLYSV